MCINVAMHLYSLNRQKVAESLIILSIQEEGGDTEVKEEERESTEETEEEEEEEEKEGEREEEIDEREEEELEGEEGEEEGVMKLRRWLTT